MTRRDVFCLPLVALVRPSRIDRSRISAITDEVAPSPAEAIRFAQQHGLKWVELRAVPGRKTYYQFLEEPELRAARKELDAAGLRVSFLNTGLLKFPLPGTEPPRYRNEDPELRARRLARDQAEFDRRMEDLRKAIRAAHLLGTDKVRVFAFTRVAEPLALLPRIAQILEPMVALAEKENIRLLVENEASCNVATCAEAAELLKLLPSKHFGLNWDADNGAAFNEIPFPDGYNLLPKHRIGNVQIKGRSVLQGPQRLDWAAIFRAMEADGYQGCFGLETHIFGPDLFQKSHECMREILRIVDSIQPGPSAD
ncbi:MAG: sugar phosphate isomerase/epimerase family protein [Bryobacterales bacterium]|nr:sugar phosphate isomerase/epimerase [Bryobacteraceae bacterium]MDW8130676.1 sugar phosphate isomerase/epimerase family protein [Bryobacterales bacterium]